MVRALCVLALCTGFAVAADAVKSGPQTGEKIPGPFKPTCVNGETAGDKTCLVCSNGKNPVVMIFARETSSPLTALIKKVNEATEKNSDKKLGSFVVFCNDNDKLTQELKDLAKKEKIEKTILSVMGKKGPEKYNVSPDADVTVVLYNKHQVMANHTFKKGQLTEKDVDVILKDLSKILN